MAGEAAFVPYEAYVVTEKKRPVWPSGGRWKEPEGVASFKDASEEVERREDAGYGVILEHTPYVCFDFDKVISESGEWHPKVLGMFEWMHENEIPYFAEYSSSLTGLHLFFETEDGSLPFEDRKESCLLDDEPFFGDALPKVEAFDSRHIALTGNLVHGSQESVPPGDERVEEVHSQFERKNGSSGSFGASGSGALELEEASKAVRQIRATIEEKASHGSEKAETCLELWDGERRLLPDSQNETDASLVARLHFWTGGSAKLIDECFRTSALYREKWDDVHYGNGDTYGERLIADVQEEAHSVYQGRYTPLE